MAYAHYRGPSAENELLAYANACRSNSSSPLDHPARSQSQSPKFNIADFENNVQFPQRLAHPSSAARRETSYASQANIDDLDFQRSSGENTPTLQRYRGNINTSFLKRSASKLLPKAITTANLPTPPPSQPGSALPSPTKSLSSFITGNSAISSSASKASVRAKTASRVLFDNYFNGESNNVLRPSGDHSRSNSSASIASPSREEGYEQDIENMATQSYTRPPLRTRPRRTTTMESTTSTYAGKIGGWFSKQSPAKTASHGPLIHEDDPLLSLDLQSALFPYGAVDPLNPASFNDLLTAAEAVISTYQNAYKQRCAELNQLKAETALKDEELEECETRAQSLKSQLVEMSEQCTAQTQKAESLEGMLRERPLTPPACQFESNETLVEGRRHVRGNHAASDSGFESDGESVFSQASPMKARMVLMPSRPATAAMSPVRPQYSNDLRTENEMLRRRIAELEGGVDDCMDMLSNPLAEYL